jgi:hypothetical protein
VPQTNCEGPGPVGQSNVVTGVGLSCMRIGVTGVPVAVVVDMVM